MRDQFGLKPKDDTVVYRRPYPEWYDHVMLPNRYKIPDFTKFSGLDDVSTIEHISRFSVQCGEAAMIEQCKIRLFPLSLSGHAFRWFASLPPGSISRWVQLESQFHKFFTAETHEASLVDLMALR